MNGTVLFMHQMKTGGVTLKDIIIEQYGKSRTFEIPGGTFRESARHFRTLPESEKQLYKIVFGHMFFGLHRWIPGPSVYITMLRRPIERVVSLYHYQLRPRHKYHISPRMSLEEYLNLGIAVNADNGMTRFIAGKDIDEVPYGECTAEMLELAKQNLTRHFIAVGITERFDESLLLFKQLLKWEKIPYYRRKNVNPQKPDGFNLTDKEMDAVIKYNGLDIELYDYAETLLKESLNKQNHLP